MKTIKQVSLLKSILTSDLVYISGSSCIKNVSTVSNIININNKTKHTVLNPILLLQNIKQLIRLIQYHGKQYQDFLEIITSSNLNIQLIDYVSKTYGTQRIYGHRIPNAGLSSKTLLFIDNQGVSKQCLQRIFSTNKYTTIDINSVYNKNIWGNYKIFTDINNYKKLLFILLLIILTQRNN